MNFKGRFKVEPKILFKREVKSGKPIPRASYIKHTDRNIKLSHELGNIWGMSDKERLSASKWEQYDDAKSYTESS